MHECGSEDRSFGYFFHHGGRSNKCGNNICAVGGGAANSAVTFARQGFSTACVAAVGEDVSGEEVRRGLLRERIDTRFLVTKKRHPTAYAILILSPGGERTILVYRGASEYLEARDIPWKRVAAKWFYMFPGSALAATEQALAHAKRNGIRVALDPSGPMLKRGSAYFKKLLPSVDVLILNREEGSRITGTPYSKPEAIFKKIDAWMPCLAVLTDGKRGVHVSDGVNMYSARIYKEKKVVDRTGAGDAFGSGFVAGLIRGLTTNDKRQTTKRIVGRRSSVVGQCILYPPAIIERAIRLGSANATSVVEYVGAKEGILTKSDFQKSRWQKLHIARKRL